MIKRRAVTFTNNCINTNGDTLNSSLEELVGQLQKTKTEIVLNVMHVVLGRQPEEDDYKDFALGIKGTDTYIIYQGYSLGRVFIEMGDRFCGVKFEPQTREVMITSEQVKRLQKVEGVISVQETDSEVLLYVNKPESQIQLPLNESGDKPIKIIPPMHG